MEDEAYRYDVEAVTRIKLNMTLIGRPFKLRSKFYQVSDSETYNYSVQTNMRCTACAYVF
jgi:hypothetical protein